jgi:hypothetical protein
MDRADAAGLLVAVGRRFTEAWRPAGEPPLGIAWYKPARRIELRDYPEAEIEPVRFAEVLLRDRAQKIKDDWQSGSQRVRQKDFRFDRSVTAPNCGGDAMTSGPRMAFLLHCYSMTPDEAAADYAHDLQLRKLELLSEREFYRRCAARRLGQRLRRDDDRMTAATTRTH